MSFNIDLAAVKKQTEQTIKESTIVEDAQKDQNQNQDEQPSSRKFNIDLKDIKESEEVMETLADFDIGDDIAESFKSALAAGIGVNALINENIINEARGVIKTVVRKGKLTQKIVCPPGFKVVKGNCEKRTPKDAIAFSRRAKAAAKTRRSRKGSAKASIKSRNRSMLVRNKNSNAVNRLKSM